MKNTEIKIMENKDKNNAKATVPTKKENDNSSSFDAFVYCHQEVRLFFNRYIDQGYKRQELANCLLLSMIFYEEHKGRWERKETQQEEFKYSGMYDYDDETQRKHIESLQENEEYAIAFYNEIAKNKVMVNDLNKFQKFCSEFFDKKQIEEIKKEL